MRTAQYDRIYKWVGGKHLVNLLVYEIVGTWRVCLVVLHQWYPHGAGNARDMDVGVQLGNLHIVGTRTDGSWSSEYTYMPAVCYVADTLCRRTYDAEYTVIRGKYRKISLLDGAQCLGRCGIAGKYDQWTAFTEQSLHSLQGKLIHYLETAGSVWSTRIVT